MIFKRQKKASSVTEFGLMVGLIAIVLIASVSGVGTQLKALFGGVNAVLAGEMPEDHVSTLSWDVASTVSGTVYRSYLWQGTTLPLATDTEGKAISYRLIGETSGVSVSPSTAELTATFSETGDVSLQAEATNGEDRVVRTFTFTVLPEPSSCLALLQAGYSSGDGGYLLLPSQNASDTAEEIYCDMTTDGGGWTQIRHVPTTSWWAYDDNFTCSQTAGTYTASLTGASAFGRDWCGETFSDYLFSTTDSAHWIVLSQADVETGYVETASCVQEVTLKASSIGAVTVEACKRTLQPEDPWLSTRDHTYANAGSSDAENHSMLWGENNYDGWNYWRQNHNGINVFIR